MFNATGMQMCVRLMMPAVLLISVLELNCLEQL